MTDTWLITGGAGFIGSHFVYEVLMNTTVNVVVMDNLTYAGRLQNLAGLEGHPRLHHIRADIADRSAVAAVFGEHRPAAVINLAAETHVDRSIDGPAAFIQTNVVGTFELLEASRKLVASGGRDSFRFLQVSTDEVYGSLDGGRVDEEASYQPNSVYSASKASADHLVRAYHKTFQMGTVITHCSNNYGPRQLPEKLIPLAILNAIEAKPIPIYGDGENVRDWIYVKDHASGILKALEWGTPGQTYNLGADNELTNLQVIDALCAGLEAEFPASTNPAMLAAGVASYADLKAFVEDRPGHDRRYSIDSSKIRSNLGWYPKASFNEALRTTIQWYLANRGSENPDLRSRRGV